MRSKYGTWGGSTIRTTVRWIALLLVLMGVLVHPSDAAYRMYRKPLKGSLPISGDLFPRSPKRTRPFEYRKNFVPRTSFRLFGITKALPPLDLRIKPETPFDIFRGDIVFEDSGSLSRDISAAREAENGFHGFPAPIDPPEFTLRGQPSGKATAEKFSGPLRIAFIREEHGAPSGDTARMLGQLTDLLGKHTGIEVRNRGMITLSSGSPEGLDILFFPGRESLFDSLEVSSVARFLRNGGFLVMDRSASGVRTDYIREKIETALAGICGEPVVSLPIESRHPIFRAFFDLTGSDFSAYSLQGIWIGNRLALLCPESGVSLLSTQTPEQERRLRFLVNTVVYTLTGPHAAQSSISR